MRLIDADALDNMGYELHRTYREDANTMVYEVKKIGEIPTIDAEPVRRGRWIPVKGYEGILYKCSACDGRWSHTTIKTPYCCQCGAKMEDE